MQRGQIKSDINNNNNKNDNTTDRHVHTQTLNYYKRGAGKISHFDLSLFHLSLCLSFRHMASAELSSTDSYTARYLHNVQKLLVRAVHRLIHFFSFNLQPICTVMLHTALLSHAEWQHREFLQCGGPARQDGSTLSCCWNTAEVGFCGKPWCPQMT